MSLSVFTDIAAEIEEKLAAKSEAEIASLDEALAIDWSERYAMQTLQSRAHAMGKIDTELASFVYRLIGESGSEENGNWPAHVTTAQKVLCVMMIDEIRKL